MQTYVDFLINENLTHGQKRNICEFKCSDIYKKLFENYVSLSKKKGINIIREFVSALGESSEEPFFDCKESKLL